MDDSGIIMTSTPYSSSEKSISFQYEILAFFANVSGGQISIKDMCAEDCKTHLHGTD